MARISPKKADAGYACLTTVAKLQFRSSQGRGLGEPCRTLRQPGGLLLP